MKNNTKIRLHLSKNLFESLAAEVLAEAKVNGGGAYTEVVKAPKQHKEKKASKPKEEGVEEMETRVAEKKVKEDLRKGVSDNFEEWKKSFPEGTEFVNKNNYMVAVKDGKELGKWNPAQKQGMHADDFQYKNLEEVGGAEMEALKDFVQFVSDNAGFLSTIGGITGLAAWAGKKIGKTPGGQSALDRSTGAGSSHLGGLGGKSFGGKKD